MPSAAAPEAASAERRLVSVLFVDLVGFTAASEGRDAEDTRERLHATPWLERVDAPGLRARVGSVVG